MRERESMWDSRLRHHHPMASNQQQRQWKTQLRIVRSSREKAGASAVRPAQSPATASPDISTAKRLRSIDEQWRARQILRDQQQPSSKEEDASAPLGPSSAAPRKLPDGLDEIREAQTADQLSEAEERALAVNRDAAEVREATAARAEALAGEESTPKWKIGFALSFAVGLDLLDPLITIVNAALIGTVAGIPIAFFFAILHVFIKVGGFIFIRVMLRNERKFFTKFLSVATPVIESIPLLKVIPTNIAFVLYVIAKQQLNMQKLQARAQASSPRSEQDPLAKAA